MASEWTEHTTDKGRKYWHSKTSNTSVWEKPDELKTSHERAISKTPWKEYEYEDADGSKDGRKYYVHSETKETTWEVPDEVKEALNDMDDENSSEQEQEAEEIGPVMPAPENEKEETPQLQAQTESELTPSSSTAPTSTTPLPAPPASLPSRPSTATPAPAISAPPVPPVPMQVEFDTPEQARQGFQTLLRESGVTPSWTWEQTMHTIVTHPVYKALKTLAERKSAFEEYISQVKAKEKEHKEKNLERLRPTWREALGRACGRENGMKLWWSWPRSMRYLIAKEPEVWKSAKEDEERENLWRDFVRDMRRKEDVQNRELKERNETKLAKLFASLNLEIDEPWREVRRLVMNEPAWKQDPELQRIEMIDFLVIFERTVKDKEANVIDIKNKKRKEKRRQQRKIREAFKDLLQTLKNEGKIKASTKWSDIYLEIRDDNRYVDLLGNIGSSPLELFWDVVDEEYLKVDEHTRAIVNVLSTKDWRVQENTQFSDFMNVLKSCLNNDVGIQDGDEDDSKEASQTSWRNKIEKMSDANLREAFELIHTRAVNLAKDERKRREKKYRTEIDDLRYVLRKLDPPISLDTTFEEVIPRIELLPEYKALDDESLRRTAFEKFIRRLKEKLREEQQSDNESVGSKRRSRHETPQAERKKHKSARYSASPQWTHDRGLDYGDSMDVDEDRRRHSSRRSRPDDDYEADRRERRGRRVRDRERDRDRDREKEKERERVRERDREKDTDRRERRRERKSQSPRKESKEEKDKDRKLDAKRNEDSELEEGEI